ncbi:hypothetical protein LCGC14_1666940 [marine sediment metagenome]|uniref:Uncharacterized protein n=1 Tax=marine sediment metagenome TaxID=412755 RepID=A0A0F9KSD1_9ZZZZ
MLDRIVRIVVWVPAVLTFGLVGLTVYEKVF